MTTRNTSAYSDIPFYNWQGSQRLGLPQLGDELVALDEAGEPALGAGREPAHPLAADEDVRQRTLAVQLAELHARRRALGPKRKPLEPERHILKLAASALEHGQGLSGEGREAVRVDDDRRRADGLSDVGLDGVLVVRAQVEDERLQQCLEIENRTDERHRLTSDGDRKRRRFDLDRSRWRSRRKWVGELGLLQPELLEKLGHHHRRGHARRGTRRRADGT